MESVASVRKKKAHYILLGSKSNDVRTALDILLTIEGAKNKLGY